MKTFPCWCCNRGKWKVVLIHSLNTMDTKRLHRITCVWTDYDRHSISRVLTQAWIKTNESADRRSSRFHFIHIYIYVSSITRNPQRGNDRNVKKKKKLYFFFCCEKFSKDKWKCNTSSFSETVLVRGNRPWGVCLFTVLWSAESTDLCCYSRLSPDPPRCRQSLIISHPPASKPHIMPLRWILCCCLISDLPPVLISLHLTWETRVCRWIKTLPLVECILLLGREPKYLRAVGSAPVRLSVGRCFHMYCITKNNIF